MACLSSPAEASEADARTFFARGRELRLEGDCTRALVEFQRAYEAYPAGLGSLRNIAECQQQLGLSASARRSWWELRRATLHSGDAKYSGWAEHAETQHAALEQQVPRVTIEIRGAAPDQVEVSIAAERLRPSMLGAELERDPGSYRIEVRARDQVLAVRRVELAAGARERVVLSVTLPPEPAKPLPPPSPAGDDAAASPDLTMPAAILTSLGGVALIGSAVALGLRQDALADLKASCPAYASSPCPLTNQAATEDALSRGRTASLLVNVLAAGGGAVTAAGIALFIADAAAPSTATPAHEPGEAGALQPLLGPAYLGAHLRF